MRDDNKVCGECAFRKSALYPDESGKKSERIWFCVNIDSVYYDEETNYGDTCKEWTKK